MHVDYSNIINSEENTPSTVFSAVPLFVSLDGLVVKEFDWKILYLTFPTCWQRNTLHSVGITY